MSEVLFSQKEAQNYRGELLLVSLPQVIFERISLGVHIQAHLPPSDQPAYTSTRAGRKTLEARRSAQFPELLRRFQNTGKRFSSQNVRGMSGGIVYTHEENFILQSKNYAQTGYQFLSGFTGLSSSFEEILSPQDVICREALEELVIADATQGKIYIPQFRGTPLDWGKVNDWESQHEHEILKLMESLKQRSHEGLLLNEFNRVSLPVTFKESSDVVEVYNSQGNLESSSHCIVDIHPYTNNFEVLNIVELENLPSTVHFYAPECGNTIARVPFSKLQELWGKWGNPISLDGYLPDGTRSSLISRAYIDSIVQTAAMHIGVIQGEKRFDYNKN
jgi:hypothetical protein